MAVSRRTFLNHALGGIISAAVLPSSILRAAERRRIKAIAFDAFPIFDPTTVFRVINESFPGNRGELQKLWLTKIFGYTWLRTSADRYKDFWQVTEDALVFSADSLGLDLDDTRRERLMQAWLNLNLWPDVKPVLKEFSAGNIRLAFLSNMTESMLRVNMKNAGIEDSFEFVLSTARVQAFKPSPEAYRMGVDAFGLPKDEIAFAAFAGWDAAGASWFGYPTIWVNRLNMPPERLDISPAAVSTDIEGLKQFVKSR